MILFSPAKINIGLHILERRPDGFHNIQSVMYPVGLCDILEIHRSGASGTGLKFTRTGIPVEEGPGENLCEKAYALMVAETTLPPVHIHLHKQIPVGAGLGGGSSNASATLKGLYQLSGRRFSLDRLHGMALRLGSDCPFFLHREPMMMEGRGEQLTPSKVNLGGFYLAILFPGIHISTAEAYAGATPAAPRAHLSRLVDGPVDQWNGLVVNDFEKAIFARYPDLGYLKSALCQAGAIYASMSGSGSSVYGIFREPPVLPGKLDRLAVWKGKADLTPAAH
jgi:4-diphosphocytidyl-2-C-methyl-D-erythritol kinase